MGKIRYLIYGSIIVGIFIVLHWIFPRKWSIWLRNMDLLFTTPPLGFPVLVIIGVFFFRFEEFRVKNACRFSLKVHNFTTSSLVIVGRKLALLTGDVFC